MRPVIEKNKFEVRYIVYIIIIIICIIAVGIAIYMQFFRDEKLGVIFGLSKYNRDEEYEALKGNFFNIFTNDVEIVENYTGKYKKIKENDDIVLLAYNTQETKDNYYLDIKIPYFNINESLPKQINQEIKTTFKDKSESILSSDSENYINYDVNYKAYINNDIISLIIMSDLKEGSNSQRRILQTFNYNLKENREVEIDEIINNKGININEANDKIKEEINASQEQNIRLSEAGYDIKVRDANSAEYKIENAEEFFIGQNGYLYVVYPYGNNEFTSEMDVVIFR